MGRAYPLLILLVTASLAAAQQPGVELQLPTRTLELGEAINAQLVCTNTGMPETPEAAVPEGLELVLTNPTPSRSSFTSIVNNQRTDKTTYTYSMRLVALKQGSYALGPVTVVAGGRTYQTDPVPIVVRAIDTTSTPKGDRFLFVEMDVEPRSLYVTQSLTATLEIGIRKVRISGRTININLFRNVLDQRASEFSIFPGGKESRHETWLTDSSGQRHRFEILRIVKQIRAEQVGPLRIGPVFLKADYPLAVRRTFSLFGGLEVTRSQKETARAEAVIVEVRGPPDDGRPADFTGAIGRYKLSVSAKPNRVEQGQPVTLTISIGGKPLEGIAGPELAKQPELASRFDYAKEELVGDLERGRKVFRRAVFPKQQGEQTIPALSWSFFDPSQERYVTLTSDPIPITVDPPTSGATTIALSNETGMASSITTLTLVTGGLSPNYVDADTVLASQAFALTTPWMGLLIAPPILCLVVTLTARRRTRLRADAGLARRHRARRHARARIRQALRSGDRTQQLPGLLQALTGYLADRFDLPPGMLTPGEVHALLTARGADTKTVSELVVFLEECDARKWVDSTSHGRGDGDPWSAEQAAANVRAWIKRIEGTTR